MTNYIIKVNYDKLNNSYNPVIFNDNEMVYLGRDCATEAEAQSAGQEWVDRQNRLAAMSQDEMIDNFMVDVFGTSNPDNINERPAIVSSDNNVELAIGDKIEFVIDTVGNGETFDCWAIGKIVDVNPYGYQIEDQHGQLYGRGDTKICRI